MNSTMRPTQQKESVASNTIKPNSKIYDKGANPQPAQLLEWSNLKYGLFMIAIIAIPPLIPGASVRLLIMGYMAVIVSIYTALAVVAAVRTYRPVKATKMRTSNMSYR